MQIIKENLIKALKSVGKGDITELLYGLEKAVIHLRNNYDVKDSAVFEKPKPCKIEKVFGKAEVTSEGWLHITLNILLPHCKYSGTRYITDSVCNLLSGITYPKYEKAFVAIVESCGHKTAKAFDSDNKDWKTVINALKGKALGDDNQFNCHIGLFAKNSGEIGCDIFVIPFCDVGNFVSNLYGSL